MSNFCKSLCSLVERSKIKTMCDLMECAHFERELLLDYLCEPKVAIENLDYSNKHNYKQRLANIEPKILSFIMSNQDFFSYEQLAFLLYEASKK